MEISDFYEEKNSKIVRTIKNNTNIILDYIGQQNTVIENKEV